MMVATVPIIAPIMFKAGYDPVWFGIMIIILMELAMITPPVGINLYVVQGLRKRGRIDDVIIGASPFVITMLLMIADPVDLAADRAVAAADGGELAALERDHDVAARHRARRGRRAARRRSRRIPRRSAGRRGRWRDRRGSAPASPASRARRRNRPGARPARAGLGRLDVTLCGTPRPRAGPSRRPGSRPARPARRGRRDGRRSARAPRPNASSRCATMRASIGPSGTGTVSS